jgi:hypothetical protein
MWTQRPRERGTNLPSSRVFGCETFIREGDLRKLIGEAVAAAGPQRNLALLRFQRDGLRGEISGRNSGSVNFIFQSLPANRRLENK